MTALLGAVRRLLAGSAADADRASRRAGRDDVPVIAVSPRTWVALG